MSQPTAYEPAHEFLTDEGANPQFPGSELDIEFAALDITLSQILTNLALIQRDDGALKNGIVTTDSLDTVLAAAFGDTESIAEVQAMVDDAEAAAAAALASQTAAATSASTASTAATNAAASAVTAAASAASVTFTIDTDTTLAANSDVRVPSQKAIKTYTDGRFTSLAAGVSASLDTLAEIETALGLKAALASPTLTGVPAAPTAASGTNTTQIATTAFVKTEIPLVARGQGKETIFIPASAMVSRTTNGPSVGTVEQTTNKNMVRTLDFDGATQEFAQFAVWFPKSWNLGTVTFQPSFSQLTTAAGGVVFGLAGVAVSDGDSLDAAFGTAQTSTKTAGTANIEYQGPESSAITIAGTPAAGDRVMFQINRTVADGSDTLVQDARLHGVRLFFTTNAATDL